MSPELARTSVVSEELRGSDRSEAVPRKKKPGGRGGIRRPSTSGDPKIKAGFTSVRKQTYL
jgi:hypothetical protein